MVCEGSDHRAVISIDAEGNKSIACGSGLDARSPEAEQPGGLLGAVFSRTCVVTHGGNRNVEQS